MQDERTINGSVFRAENRNDPQCPTTAPGPMTSSLQKQKKLFQVTEVFEWKNIQFLYIRYFWCRKIILKNFPRLQAEFIPRTSSRPQEMPAQLKNFRVQDADIWAKKNNKKCIRKTAGLVLGWDWGFLKWWYPTTMGFPTKFDHFGVFWGYHYLRKHPDIRNV